MILLRSGMDTAAVTRRLDDLSQATGLTVLWKDADPLLTDVLPPRCCRHLSAYCRMVKRDRARLARCIDADNAGPWLAAHGVVVFVRDCPFGVREAVLPLRTPEGACLGLVMVGPARGRRPVAGQEGLHARLPVVPARRLLAVARLAGVVLSPLLIDHDRARCDQADDAVVRQTLDLLDREARVGLPLALAARRVGLSASRLAHRFRAVTGASFGQALRRRLMRRAAGLLEQGMPVTEVALTLGYANPAHFAQVFRRHLGCAPSRWRRQA